MDGHVLVIVVSSSSSARGFDVPHGAPRGGRAARALLGVQLHVRIHGRADGGPHDGDKVSDAHGDLRAYPNDGDAILRAHDGDVRADIRTDG